MLKKGNNIMKRFCICLILSVIALMHSSCTQDATYLEQRFCDIYELPSDFSEALKYIDSEIVDRKFYAYMQLIVENPQSFYFDFNAIDEAPAYETSHDGKLRIYSFYVDKYEYYSILQFCNSKGKIITTHFAKDPLFLEMEEMVSEEEDYEQYCFISSVKVLGQIEINGVTTYIVYVDATDYSYYSDDVGNECVFVTGLQLTETGYKYVPIFKMSNVRYICPTGEDMFYVERIRSVWDAQMQLYHGDAWYDESEKLLHIPYSIENPSEKFNIYKWNEDDQMFEPTFNSSYDYSPGIHESLGNTYGLEIVMCFGDLLVRVDKAEPYACSVRYSYKYTAWGKGKTMKDVPDLMLYGNLDECLGTFHFVNGEYEYIVPCADNRYNNKLLVKKNGKVILQKEVKQERYDY